MNSVSKVIIKGVNFGDTLPIPEEATCFMFSTIERSPPLMAHGMSCLPLAMTGTARRKRQIVIGVSTMNQEHPY